MSRIKQLAWDRHFWIVVVMLTIVTLFHYVSFGPALGTFPAAQRGVVRIVYLLPVAAAAFAFGRAGGIATLALSVALMLPRVLLISPDPVDALFETLGVTIVGYVIIWMIETQEEEKRMRQRVVEELQAVNAIALTLTQPYDLDRMLDNALARVLQVVGGLRSRGAVFLLDPWGETLHLRAHHGVPDELVAQVKEVPLGECLCGISAKDDQVLIVADALNHPQHTRCPDTEPHAHACVPLKSKQRVVGVMDFYIEPGVPLHIVDRDMLAAIGHQIGVAVENARLCENLRYYVRKVTSAQEEERKRIARDLHDETLQSLIDLTRRIDVVATDTDVPATVVQRLELLHQRMEEVTADVRRFSRDLRPSVLDDLGLLPAIESLLADLEQDGIKTSLGIEGSPRRLDPAVEIDLYRVVQESLNNVRRHSKASRVVVSAQYGEKRLRITIQDNGKGFEWIGQAGDFATLGMYGMVGMEERANRWRGQMKVLTTPGKGTVVMVEVPVETTADRDSTPVASSNRALAS